MSDYLATFDIWDTCLVRASGTPHTVFTGAAHEVLGASEAEVAALAQRRIEAEQAAREDAERSECTIAEIEVALARAIGARRAAQFIQTELRLERASVRPVVATLAEVQKARAAGATVAFASDMYLPEAFLRELLATHGFATPGDPVFVSGDRRANKHSGRLFKIIRQELGVRGGRWLHYGDNPRSDIAAARRQGIKTVEVRLADWTPAERRAIKAGRRHGERIAGAMRAVRLGTSASISPERASFLAGIAAPWLFALTTRVISMARATGVRRLYFVARDGDIPLRLARILAAEDIECRYLFGSRKAWCFPAMVDFSEACTSWLKLTPMRPDTLLTSLGFSETERSAVLKRCGIDGPDRNRRHSQVELAPIWSDIRANSLEESIIKRAGAAREMCVEYLRSQKLIEDVPWAIVDVGWSLHGQAALKRMLSHARAPHEPQGFYFMMRRDRRPESETGPVRAWITEESSPDGELLSWMSPVIEECFLTSADPGVIGFRTTGGIATPVHAEPINSAATDRHAAELRLFAEGFAREVLPDIRDPEFRDELESCALQGLTAFLHEPEESEAVALRGLRHTTAPGAAMNDSQPIVRPYSFADALNLLLRRAGLRRSAPNREPYWHAGSMAVSPSLARAGMKAAHARNPLRRILGKSG